MENSTSSSDERDSSASTDADVLAATVRRFSGLSGVVERLWSRSDEFGELCRDYHDCLAAMDRLSHAGVSGIADYRELAEELAREIRLTLKAFAESVH